MIKKFLCLLLMTFAFLSPVTVHAQSNRNLFEVAAEIKPMRSIAPGDNWSDSFKVTNNTTETIKVKLDHLENRDDSSLYDVLQVEINGQTFRHLDDVTSDWITLKKNDTYVFYTEFHFPNEYKNEYQGKTFRARLFFQCEAPEGSILNQNGDIVQTGDETSIRETLILCISCGLILLWTLLWRIRRQQK